MTKQNYINHIALVLDASASMSGLTQQTIAVADNQVAYLAQRSKELDQETRMTVYTFNTKVECVYYDKDVLRLPSLRNDYKPNGMTALIDATMKSLHDLEKTATLYGDHAFLIYVLTDGQENASAIHANNLRDKLQRLPDNWTVAVMVPDQTSIFEAKKFGFQPNNIAVWDTSAKGIAEVGETIRRATDNFMQARASGVRGSSNIFNLDAKSLDKAVSANALTKLRPHQYRVFPVVQDGPIAETVEMVTGIPYKIGSAFYELSKRETIQANKQIAVRDRHTSDLYTGKEARQLLNLPDYEVRVSPVDHPDYDIFVQSTSVNRKLIAGTDFILL